MMPRFLAILALVAASSANAQSPVARAEKIRVAVMDFNAAGVPVEVAASLTSIVAGELERLQVFSVISGDEIRAMITREAQAQALGCESDSSCLAEIGGALGTRFLVSGSIGKIGDQYALNLALTDSEAAKVVGRSSETAKEQNRLVDMARVSTSRVVQSVLAERQATLIVTCPEPGATVKIDDQVVGVTPLPHRSITWGVHTIVVEKQGFISAIEEFSVLTNAAIERSVTLIPSPDFLAAYEGSASKYRLGAWLTTAGTVVALGAGAWFQSNHLGLAQDFEDKRKTYDRTSQAAYDELERVQGAANTAVKNAQVSAGLGLLFGAGAAFFWIAGDDPDRYARYRAVALRDDDADDEPTGLAFRPFAGPGLISAALDFD